MGGKYPFLELLEKDHLRNPFIEGNVKKVVAPQLKLLKTFDTSKFWNKPFLLINYAEINYFSAFFIFIVKKISNINAENYLNYVFDNINK